MTTEHHAFQPVPEFDQHKDLARIENLVRCLLDTYIRTEQSYHGQSAVPTSRYLFKISEGAVHAALPDLQNTKYRRVMDLVHDILNTDDIIEQYGVWVCVSFDDPDFVFIRLPSETVTALRLCPRASSRKRSAKITVSTRYERLGNLVEEQDTGA